MRENLERTNIVLPKDLKERLKKHAKKTHGSLSQFLRMAALNEIEGDDEPISDVDLRPVLEWMEKAEERLERMENMLEELEKAVSFLVNERGSTVEKVADDIQDLLLQRNEPLSVPEMSEILGYSKSETIRGVEKAEDELVAKRVRNENGPSKWKIRGGRDEQE